MIHATFYSVLILVTFKVYAVPINDTESWTGKWFPENPLKVNTHPSDLNDLFNSKQEEIHSEELLKGSTENNTKSWTGNWFPRNALDEHRGNPSLNRLFGKEKTEINSEKSWKGKWFPGVPSDATITSIERNIDVSPECDDGKKNIAIDFDPEDKRDSYKYLCLDFKSKYEPRFSIYPLQQKYTLPPAYRAPSYCLNETIEYEERLPTFGAHRYLRPKFGEYKFLPAQRWIHSLKDGAIVMLYHPCAYQMQVEKLKTTLKACLYRHIITPSTLLLPERPLALVAWSKSLEMSVVDVPTVVSFIKKNAGKADQTTQDHYKEYDAGLLVEARLVTDESDSEICANINM